MSNNCRKPKLPFWRGTVLLRLLFLVAPLPKRTFCSIDVTAKCNLRCTHCYHFLNDQPPEPELTVDEWISRIEEMQAKKGYLLCTWVGGEPLLRKDLVECGRKFFHANRVVTNGTIELPDWPDVEFHVSVDGTKTSHDAIRGDGCYAKIKRNLENSRYDNLNIAIACCLNRENVGGIDELIKEWKQVPNIRHILFDFLTPMKGGANEDMWLTFEERDKALAKLKELQGQYGDFIGAPPGTFDLMHSSKSQKAVGENCVFINNGLALDAWGNPKKPCVMGPKADCSRCGCIVPFSVKAWKKPSNLMREIFQSFNK